ncbi:MAG: TolC family protein [Pseudomonadota bacterium]
MVAQTTPWLLAVGLALALSSSLSACHGGGYRPRPLDERGLLAEAPAGLAVSAASPSPLPSPLPPAVAPTPPSSSSAAPVLADPDTGKTAGSSPETARLQPGRSSTDQAVALALVHNPDIRAARYERGIAEGEVMATEALANPSLRLEALDLQDLGEAGVGFGVALSWEPPRPIVRSARQRRAQAQVTEEEQEIREQEWRIATAVRVSHATLVALAEQVRIFEDAVSTRQHLVGLVEQRMAQGAATRIDLGIARLAAVEVERERNDVALRYAAAVEDFRALLGVAADDTPVEIGSDDFASERMADLMPPPDERRLAEQAFGLRPAFGAARARYEQSEQALREEHGRKLPWFRLAAAPRFRTHGGDGDEPDLMVGLVLQLPVLDRNDGPILAAEARRSQARERFAALLASVRREIRQSLAAIARGQAAVRYYRERILPAIEEQDRELDAALQGGVVDLVAVMAARAAALKSRLAYSNACLELRTAWLALDRSVGAPVQPRAR